MKRDAVLRVIDDLNVVHKVGFYDLIVKRMDVERWLISVDLLYAAVAVRSLQMEQTHSYVDQMVDNTKMVVERLVARIINNHRTIFSTMLKHMVDSLGNWVVNAKIIGKPDLSSLACGEVAPGKGITWIVSGSDGILIAGEDYLGMHGLRCVLTVVEDIKTGRENS